MTQLVVATHNVHKLLEIKSLLPDRFHLLSLDDAGLFEDIPETADTLEGNARQKADYVFTRIKKHCFADDTGIEVAALNGRPGVFSARYAGKGCTYHDNNLKLLEELRGLTHREACFRTIICLIYNGMHHYFEGRVNGVVINEFRGNEGFGYDPVFMPDGYSLTFAEMELEEKNSISHRSIAVHKLRKFLEEI